MPEPEDTQHLSNLSPSENKRADAINAVSQQGIRRASLVIPHVSVALKQGAFETECIRRDNRLSLPNLHPLLELQRSQLTE